MNVIKILLALGVLTSLAWSSSAQDKYNSFGKRDPFVPLMGVTEVQSRGGLAGIFAVDDVTLQGIVTAPDGTKSAIINGEVINEDQRVGSLYIESIGKNEIVIKINEERHVVKLFSK